MGRSKEEFIIEIKEKYNEPFEILEYSGTSKPGSFKCGYCGETYPLAKIGKLLNPDRKHICSHCFASKYADEVLSRIDEEEDLIFVKFGYNKSLHKPTVSYKCKKCGEITTKPYIEFLKYPTCIHCGKNSKRKNGNGIINDLPEGFELVGEYNGMHNKTLFRHKCGFIFSTRPKDLISGHTYCPKCSKKASKGERKIINFLESNKIAFEKERVFPWSERKRYDFFLPDYNLLIEYNGIQHYKEVPNFKISLEEQKKIDSFKENKARSKGYSYLVISYEEYEKIEGILAQRLEENT